MTQENFRPTVSFLHICVELFNPNKGFPNSQLKRSFLIHQVHDDYGILYMTAIVLTYTLFQECHKQALTWKKKQASFCLNT